MSADTKAVGHTKGPWEVFDMGRDGNVRVETNGKGSICKLARKPDFRDREQELANARLIAAAPELLEALEMAYAVLCSDEGEIAEWDIAQARAETAIRKARGESL